MARDERVTADVSRQDGAIQPSCSGNTASEIRAFARPKLQHGSPEQQQDALQGAGDGEVAGVHLAAQVHPGNGHLRHEGAKNRRDS